MVKRRCRQAASTANRRNRNIQGGGDHRSLTLILTPNSTSSGDSVCGSGRLSILRASLNRPFLAGSSMPETVIRWHRRGFRAFWRWKSRPGVGRPPIDGEIRHLIRQMSMANPLWGAPRIHGELLEIDVAQSTVAKYMVPRSRRPIRFYYKTFDDCAGPDAAHVDPTHVHTDLEELWEKAKKLVQFANTKIAHLVDEPTEASVLEIALPGARRMACRLADVNYHLPCAGGIQRLECLPPRHQSRRLFQWQSIAAKGFDRPFKMSVRLFRVILNARSGSSICFTGHRRRSVHIGPGREPAAEVSFDQNRTKRCSWQN